MLSSAWLRLGDKIRKPCLLMEEEGGPESMGREVVLPKTESCQEKIKVWLLLFSFKAGCNRTSPLCLQVSQLQNQFQLS